MLFCKQQQESTWNGDKSTMVLTYRLPSVCCHGYQYGLFSRYQPDLQATAGSRTPCLCPGEEEILNSKADHIIDLQVPQKPGDATGAQVWFSLIKMKAKVLKAMMVKIQQVRQSDYMVRWPSVVKTLTDTYTTCHQGPPVCRDHIFYNGRWGGLSRQVPLYFFSKTRYL